MFLFKNRVFFQGCVIRAAYPQAGKRWVNILRRAGINTIILPEERCCGSPLKNAGATNEFENNASKLCELLDKYHVGEVITACPACAHTLSHYLRIPVRHVTQVIADKLGKKIKKPMNMAVSFHDPCHLARYLDAVAEPRRILEACGCKVLEPEPRGRFTYCCGGGGGLPANHPDVAGKITRERVRQLASTGAEAVVTSCPMCVHQLQKYSKVPVVDLSEIVAGALGVEK